MKLDRMITAPRGFRFPCKRPVPRVPVKNACYDGGSGLATRHGKRHGCAERSGDRLVAVTMPGFSSETSTMAEARKQRQGCSRRGLETRSTTMLFFPRPRPRPPPRPRRRPGLPPLQYPAPLWGSAQQPRRTDRGGRTPRIEGLMLPLAAGAFSCWALESAASLLLSSLVAPLPAETEATGGGYALAGACSRQPERRCSRRFGAD